MDDEIIGAVRGNECLYNTRDINYNNKAMKESVWQDLAEKLDITAGECQRRWKSLRDKYVRDFDKEPDNQKYPELTIKMQFLKEFIRKKTYIYGELTNLEEYSPPPQRLPSRVSHNPINYDDENSYELKNGSSGKSKVGKRRHDHERMREKSRKRLRLAGAHEDNYEKFCACCLTRNMDELVHLKAQLVDKKSRNYDYLKLLDNYLQKLDEDVQDAIKLDLLATVQQRIEAIRNNVHSKLEQLENHSNLEQLEYHSNLEQLPNHSNLEQLQNHSNIEQLQNHELNIEVNESNEFGNYNNSYDAEKTTSVPKQSPT